MEVCNEVCTRVDSMSHLELSACLLSQGDPEAHASQLDPSIESQIIFENGTVSPTALSKSPAALSDKLASYQIITNCVSLRSICTEASGVHAKRRFAGRTQGLYGILFYRYVAKSRHVELMNHCCIISLGLVVGLCQEHQKLQVCCVGMHFCGADDELPGYHVYFSHVLEAFSLFKLLLESLQLPGTMIIQDC